MKKIKINNGQPYPLGASVREGGINFSMVNSSDKDCGIIFYRKGVEKKDRIYIDRRHRIGNIWCVLVEGITACDLEYNFFIGDEVFVDPYAKKIVGNEKWRMGEYVRPLLRGGFDCVSFDWQGTAPLHIPYDRSVMYCLNVRSFTRHPSSKVKKKGTFEGLVEKIPYLKGLGVNSIELMPAYEFEECEWGKEADADEMLTMEYQVSHIDADLTLEQTDGNDGQPKARRLNCWGFKEALYFAPKASYSSDGDPCGEFRRMVRELHKNGIEVIMQFYFPDHIKQCYILEVIKHWVLEYHIDGAHLKGGRIPVTLLATEPLLANTKLMCEDFYLHEIYPDGEQPATKTLGYYRDDFMRDMRRYLKGDQDMLKNFCYHMKNIHPQCGVINFMTNYYGFTLNDLVSYDGKHNEGNGWDNADGPDHNFSWNCGVEGATRKKAIRELRHRQMKNALALLLTAQGTPLLLAGDEFGNSQDGNNNCYCQDNETGWVDWRGLIKNSDIYEFAREMIAFRKEHGILHLSTGFSMVDRFGKGYPDISYHSDEAWKVHMGSHNRHIGIMYCGKNDDGEGDYIYIAYNMHWDSHCFALPSLGNYEWITAIGTADNKMEGSRIDICPRSISVLTGRKLPEPERRQKATKAAKNGGGTDKNMGQTSENNEKIKKPAQ